MDDELREVTARVKALLEAARELAWGAFDPPAEATVMQLFSRLCAEADMTQCEAPVLGDGTDVLLH